MAKNRGSIWDEVGDEPAVPTEKDAEQHTGTTAEQQDSITAEVQKSSSAQKHSLSSASLQNSRTAEEQNGSNAQLQNSRSAVQRNRGTAEERSRIRAERQNSRNAVVQKSTPAVQQESSSAEVQRRGGKQAKTGPDGERYTSSGLMMLPSTHRQLKAWCALNEADMGEIANEAMLKGIGKWNYDLWGEGRLGKFVGKNK